MLLNFPDGSPFAQGSSNFLCEPATSGERTSRVIIQVKIQEISTRAFIDTGAAYLICNPEIATLLEFASDNSLGAIKMNIRGTSIPGSLHRVYLTFLASEGDGITIEVTAFIPDPEPNWEWELPSILGLTGCLEFLRFAIDPVTNTFYFGTLSS